MRKIIYVTGPPGSGKTSLAESLKGLGNVVSVDMDDIGDRVYAEIKKMKLEQKEKNDKQKESQFKEYAQWYTKGEELFKKILDSYVNGNKDKHLVLVGLLSYSGYGSTPAEYADVKLYITIDFQTCYKRFLKRTLQDIVSNKSKIESVIEYGDIETVFDELHHTFKIRKAFPVTYYQYLSLATATLSGAMSQGYTPIPASVIYETVIHELEREDVSK